MNSDGAMAKTRLFCTQANTPTRVAELAKREPDGPEAALKPSPIPLPLLSSVCIPSPSQLHGFGGLSLAPTANITHAPCCLARRVWPSSFSANRPIGKKRSSAPCAHWKKAEPLWRTEPRVATGVGSPRSGAPNPCPEARRPCPCAIAAVGRVCQPFGVHDQAWRLSGTRFWHFDISLWGSGVRTPKRR